MEIICVSSLSYCTLHVALFISQSKRWFKWTRCLNCGIDLFSSYSARAFMEITWISNIVNLYLNTYIIHGCKIHYRFLLRGIRNSDGHRKRHVRLSAVSTYIGTPLSFINIKFGMHIRRWPRGTKERTKEERRMNEVPRATGGSKFCMFERRPTPLSLRSRERIIKWFTLQMEIENIWAYLMQY